MADHHSRLDDFTDAAFAFAVSLLVIGGARAPEDIGTLIDSLGDIPAFAFGFALMSMFWLAHVRWRRIRGGAPSLMATFLTLLLVFLTLIYVQPLRAMAAATGQWFTGQGSGFRGEVTDLFAVYGTGFVAMALTMAALFAEGVKSAPDDPRIRAELRGERSIWLIHAVTGLASVAMSMTRWGQFAAMLYASLAITIPLFSWRYDWTGGTGEAALDRP